MRSISAAKRLYHRAFRREASCTLGPSVALIALAACTGLPPPPETEDLAALSNRYDHPSAKVPNDLVSVVLGEANMSSELARDLDGLRFLQRSVLDASSRIAKEGDVHGLELQGTIEVNQTCPGFEPDSSAEPSAAESGTLHFTLSVDHSLVRRAVRGKATACRFVVDHKDESTRVALDANLGIDLGRDTKIGAAFGPVLLVRLADLNARIAGQGATSSSQIELTDAYHFRVADDRIETLLDLNALGLAPSGSAVAAVDSDGLWSLREKRGEWRCDQGKKSCTLIR